MKTTKQIIDFIEEEISSVKHIIDERANIEGITDKSNLYELEGNPYDDSENRENHEYDLGTLYTLTRILTEINK
jgi:hypothetical protein